VKPDTSPQAIYGYTSLMALGVGFFNQAGYSVVQAKVKPEEIPWALGFMMVCKCYRPYNGCLTQKPPFPIPHP
jgi:hypothetical protein